MNFEEKAHLLNEYLHRVVHQTFVLQCEAGEDCCSDLTHQESKVVLFIGPEKARKMRELAEYQLVAMSTMTSIVDKLIKKDLVKRERSEEDRRIVYVSLTENGRDVFNHEREKLLRFSRGLLGSLDDNEQDVLIGLLKKISDKITAAD